MSDQRFKPALGLWDATMLAAGSMIGSGIFIVSADIVRNVGSVGWLMLVWVITGFMTITAAVSYGELSGMYPKAGGQYVYLKEAYNPLVAFLYGWSFFAVIQTGTIAAVAVAFSKFTAYLVPAVSEDQVALDLGILKISPAQLLAIGIIGLLTYINTRGIREGKFIQSFLTTIKIISLIGLIIFGFIFLRSDVWRLNWADAWSMHSLLPNGDAAGYTVAAALGAVAAAMVGSVFSSDAWNSVTFIAGEIKDPKRNIGLSLFLGTLTVTVIYVLANLMYAAVLPLNEIAFAAKDRVAVSAAQYIFGGVGTVVIAIMIMISTFGCNNGLILSGSRVCHAMAQDGLFFKQAARLNASSVPQHALWWQCAIASVWCLSGRYGDLLDMVSFVVVLFYVLTILGIFILRKRRPEADRPYKAFGYPVFPLMYIGTGLTFCTLLVIYKPAFTWPGLLIAMLGIPIFLISMKLNRPPNR